MYYELYVDSLFLLNFVMNLYLLFLVDRSLWRTATRLRLVLGAGVGAGMYLVPFMMGGAVWFKILIGFLLGNILMIWIAFKIHSVTAFIKIAYRLLGYSFLIGGGLRLLLRIVTPFAGKAVGMITILGMGALCTFVIDHVRERAKREKDLCRVTLINEDRKVCVMALMDSGNGLIEPISGKPVSVIDHQIFEELWKEKQPLFRAIPYHSIGKKKGILQGYLLPEMKLERNGMTLDRHEVYIAVSEEEISGYENTEKVRMIVNPQVIQGG